MMLLVAFALAASGCGGSDGDGEVQPTADVRFPRADGKTLRALREDIRAGAIFAPTVSLLERGENRVGFALFDAGRKEVTPEAVALYFAQSDKRKLEGPFVARRESLAVEPRFRSRQTAADADAIESIWVADVPFPKEGRFVLAALARVDGELVSASQYELRVGGPEATPPDVGEQAIRVNTETPEDVGGDLAQIDTRIPPLPELHDVDFADVLGKQPVVLTFATPQLCEKSVCGPVVDIVAQVAARTEGVAFIHQEIYRNNEIEAGLRPQVEAWKLPTEPWTFVIDEGGEVVERFEGALSVDELEAAVRRVGTVR